MDTRIYRLEDESYVSWDQAFSISDDGYFNNFCDPLCIPWQGGTWHLLIQACSNTARRCGVFVVCGSIEDTDPKWSCNMEFTFSLLSIDGRLLRKLHRSAVYEFTRPTPGAGTIDRGFQALFANEELLLHRRPDGTCVVRCELVKLPAASVVNQLPTSIESKAVTGMVGLENLGATCYLNALLQMLFHINMFRKEVYDLPHEQEEIEMSTTLALQSVFFKIQTEKKAVSTAGLTRSFGWNSADAFQQQDVQEMMRVLIDKLEECMKGTDRESALKNTFAGTIRSYIRCLNIDYVSQREEDFYDIQLDVSGNKDIYESFDKYVEKETLNGENKYDAGDDRGKQDAEKGVVFTKFPPVLTIHLKRFAFDMTKMGFTKIHDEFEYPSVLDLNKYLDPDVAVTGSPDDNIYRLHSVLVHAGEVYGGHYYAYIRAMASPEDGLPASSWLGEKPAGWPPGLDGTQRWRDRRDKWYKFDDERVTCASQKEAVEDCFGRPADSTTRSMTRAELIGTMSSAYMLVYIREHDANEIMPPLSSVDVPRSLQNRLLAEEAKLQFQHMLYCLSTETVRFRYVTSDDAANLPGYSFDVDFVDVSTSSKSIAVARGSKKLALHLAIARELKLTPDMLRLWVIRPRGKKGTFRPHSLIQVQDMSLDVCDEMESHDALYVQLLESEQLFPNRVEVAQAFEELDTEAEQWLDSLVGQLKSRCDIDVDDESVVRKYSGVGTDCSIATMLGCDERTAHIEFGNNIFRKYWEYMVDFQGQLFAIETKRFDQGDIEESVEPVMLIIKCFDPLNILDDEDSSGPHHKVFSALRLLGTQVFRSTDTLNDLLDVCRGMLRARCGGQNTPPEWENFKLFRIFNPRTVSEVTIGDDSDTSTTIIDCDIICGDIICLQPLESKELVLLNSEKLSNEQGMEGTVVGGVRISPMQVSDMVDVKRWLIFQTNRMIVQLSPQILQDGIIAERKAGIWNYIKSADRTMQEAPDYLTRFETSASLSGQGLLERIAEILGCPSYEFVAAAPMKGDGKKMTDFLSGSDLKQSVIQLLRRRNMNQSIKFICFSILPFDDVLYRPGDESSGDETSSDEDLVPVAGNPSGELLAAASTGDASAEEDSPALAVIGKSVACYGDGSKHRHCDVRKYPEIAIIDTRMQSLRRNFIVECLLASVNVETGGVKKQKVITPQACEEETAAFRKDDNSTPQMLSNEGRSPLCKFPSGVDVLHDGFVEEDRIFLRLICGGGFETVGSLAAQLKRNIFPGFETQFRCKTSILRRSLTSNPAGSCLPLSPREIFSLVFPGCVWSEGILGLAERRKAEVSQKWYVHSRQPPGIVADYFSEEAPSLMELAATGDSPAWDNRNPLVLLFTVQKKRIRVLLQHYSNIIDGCGVLPRSRVDCINDFVMTGVSTPATSLSLSVQYVTREDEFWMRGLHPTVRSIPISVFCCQRNANGGVTGIAGPIQPCLCFVTEEDSVESLLFRVCSAFCSACGADVDSDLVKTLSQYELLAMYPSKGFDKVFPIQQATDENHGKGSTPWEAFSECDISFDSSERWAALSSSRTAPELAIVFPVTAADGISRKRRSFAAGIKIR